MTATYWEIGRRIVEHEQRGQKRAEYGEILLEELSRDLIRRFGCGFGVIQLRIVRQFYAMHPMIDKTQPVTEQFPICQSLIDESHKTKAVVRKNTPMAH